VKLLDIPNPIEDAISETLFGVDQIQAKVDELAARISDQYQERQPLVVGILNGCFPFIADLVRACSIPLQVDFMSVSSYGDDTKSSGVVRIIKDLNQAIEGRDVLIVEDIIDTGLTLRYLIDNLRTRMPRSIEVCALLDKSEARTEDVAVKFAGFPCPNKFVVGYGLDYAGYFRNLPYIGVLKPEIYKGK
jgi:hypoxanthine phosphoribosyltransferase